MEWSFSFGGLNIEMGVNIYIDKDDMSILFAIMVLRSLPSDVILIRSISSRLYTQRP